MSNLKEIIAEIDIGRGAFLALILADVFGGGVLAILVCWPNQFFSIEPIRLGMMAVALTLPFVTLGAFSFQLAHHDRDYEKIEVDLRDTVIYSVASHLSNLLLCFLAIGLTKAMPPILTSWRPLPDQMYFWTFSGLHVCNMFVIGQGTRSPIRKWWRTPLHLTAVFVVVLLIGLGYNLRLRIDQGQQAVHAESTSVSSQASP